jgi:hypothetical protein
MPLGILRQLADQLKAQVAAFFLPEGAGVSFVHDHQLRTGALEIVPASFGFDKLG